METIKQILMRRDGMSDQEAQTSIDAARKDFNAQLEAGELPFDLCEEHFGLEPDYLDEFM